MRGWWWLGDEIVRVKWHQGEGLVVMRNGRRKKVEAVDGWQGPAVRDPRTPKADVDADIPF